MNERDMSRTALAELLGMPKSSMTRLLGGDRKMSTTELVAIAKALGVNPNYLLGTGPKNLPEMSLAARLASNGQNKDIDAIKMRTQDLLELQSVVRMLVSPVALPQPFTVEAGTRGLSAAEEVREFFGLGHKPIGDLAEFATRSLGAYVAREPLPKSFDGMVAVLPEGPESQLPSPAALILVNSDRSLGRQRYTLAHEIGHLVRGISDSVRIDYDVDKGDPEERWANNFAAELLMPAHGVRLLEGTTSSAAELVALVAARFGTSVESAINRCNTLGLVSAEEQSRLKLKAPHDLLRRHGHDEFAERDLSDKGAISPPELLMEQSLFAYMQGAIGLNALCRLFKRDDAEVLARELEDAGFVHPFA